MGVRRYGSESLVQREAEREQALKDLAARIRPPSQHMNYDVQRDRARILELLDGDGFEFIGADVLRLRGPVVYLVLRDDRPLYVGMSRYGLGRPFTKIHRALGDLRESDRLNIWPVASGPAAEELESYLIRYLMPVRNIAGRARALRARLDGVTQFSPWEWSAGASNDITPTEPQNNP